MKVEWDAHEQFDRIFSMSTLPLKAREAAKVQTSWVLASARGSISPLCCLVDMGDQLPDPFL